MLFKMEHFPDQAFALQWPEAGISAISDSNGSFELPPSTNMEQISCKLPSLSNNSTGFPNTVYYQNVHSSNKSDMSYINDVSRPPLQHLQGEFGFKNEASTSTSVTSVTTPNSHQSLMLKEYQKTSQMSPGFSVTVNPSISTHVLPSFNSTAAGDLINYHQSSTSLQPSTIWGGQAYINASQSQVDSSKTSDRLGRNSQAEFNGASPQNVQLSGSLTAGQLGSSQVMQMVNPQSYQQVQTSKGFVPPSLPANQSQPGTPSTVPAAAKPRVRARRGQATDPHSIAERLRRERIAERMKALQELVPNANKTDKASMLDEIIDYVKFLQLQVKVLSMSRLGGASAVAPLIADLSTEGSANVIPSLSSSKSVQDGLAMAESQVARLMEDDMGSAMQFLQAKGLCLMPVSLASLVSTNKSRPSSANLESQTVPAFSQPWISSTSSITTFASAASSACGDGDSNLCNGK